MDVRQRLMFVYAPFLQGDLGCVSAGLGSDEFLEIADCIVGATFHSDLKAI